MSDTTLLLLGLAAVAAFSLSRKRRTTPVEVPSEPAEPPGPATGSPPSPIAVGVPGDPQIDALLAEMNADFLNAGVDTAAFSPREVTIMKGAPNRASAIPPRAYWPRMAKTLRDVAMPLRAATGTALVVRGGYRAPDYNAAVGGEPRSRHQWFEALDLRPEPYTGETRRALALEAARLYKTLPASVEMGLGIYGDPTPNTVHIDSGWKKRKWAKAKKWLAKV